MQLTLFDPRLPDLFRGTDAVVGSSRGCRCSVRVEAQGESGMLVRLPSCRDARSCFSAGRVMRGACETAQGRVGFGVKVVSAPEDAGAAHAVLSLPGELYDANRRRTYRVGLAPHHTCRVPVCPRPCAQAWSALVSACDAGAWDASLLPAAWFAEALLTEVSLGGVGLAARESPEFTPEFTPELRGQTVLLPRVLPGLPRVLACRVEVRWFSRLGGRMVRLGGRFVPAESRTLTKQREELLGAWVLEWQRRSMRCVGR